MDKIWKELHENPPENWREIWSNRRKLIRFDYEQGACNFVKKNQDDYSNKLLIDIHPKDGYVVYESNEVS